MSTNWQECLLWLGLQKPLHAILKTDICSPCGYDINITFHHFQTVSYSLNRCNIWPFTTWLLSQSLPILTNISVLNSAVITHCLDQIRFGDRESHGFFSNCVSVAFALSSIVVLWQHYWHSFFLTWGVRDTQNLALIFNPALLILSDEMTDVSLTMKDQS